MTDFIFIVYSIKKIFYIVKNYPIIEQSLYKK